MGNLLIVTCIGQPDLADGIMHRIAEAKRYSEQYIEQKIAEIKQLEQYSVDTAEEAASVVHRLRIASSAHKHIDMGGPMIPNLPAFHKLVMQGKQAVAEQRPESFMISVPKQEVCSRCSRTGVESW